MNTLPVVVVDDATEIRHRMKNLIQDIPKVEGVGEVDDAVHALEVIETLRPQIVILDIPLLSGNGTGVLRQIKRLDPSIVVIMLTNIVVPYYRSVCLSVGADFFLDKSHDIRELESVVTELRQPRFGWNGIPGYERGLVLEQVGHDSEP